MCVLSPRTSLGCRIGLEPRRLPRSRSPTSPDEGSRILGQFYDPVNPNLMGDHKQKPKVESKIRERALTGTMDLC